MAAFTEGFTDTSKPGKDHLGSMISKVIAARKFAREERELAEEKAKKAGYDSLEELGVENGFFFKAALKSKFGGSYLSGKKQDIKQAVDRVKLLKNPKAQFWNFVDNRDAEGKKIKKLSDVERFRAQFDNYAFVSAKRPPENVEPQEEMVPDTAEETAGAASGTGKRRVSREDILSAISAIASSLEKTAQSINNTIGETKIVADGVQAIKTDVVTQLSERTDSIEAKLDAIVAAINAQTELQKKTADDAETTQAIAKKDDIKNAAATESIDDLTTSVDESTDSGDLLDDGMEPSPAATSAQDIEFQQQDMYRKPPEAETGGIISGPDEGYLAKLHGDEMVIPLDNNYTQGEPSAVDGKVRPTPETPVLPKFETGTPTKPPATSSLGGKVGFTSLDLGMGSKSSSAADAMAQPLMDAMSLPMMVAGGTILSSVNQLMNQLGPENADVAGEVAKVARPIADVFGLPNNLVNKASGGMKSEESDKKDKDKDEKVKDRKKGLLGDLFDKLKKALTGSRARPGSGGGGSGDPAASPNFTGEGGDRAMNYLMSQGLTKEQAAGVAGNLQQESTFNPRADNTGTGENDREGHFGIAQWDKVHRWPKVKKWMQDNNLDPYSLDGQLQAMVWEAKERGDWSKLKEVTDASSAAASWLANFERSGEQPGDHGYDARIANAKMWAAKKLPTASPESPTGSPTAPSTVNSAQEITENYGLKVGQTFDFSVPGKGNFQAYKTGKGFAIFKYGGIGSLVGRNQEIDTSDGKNASIVQALMAAGRERQVQAKAAAANQTITAPTTTNGQTPQQIAAAKQEALKPPAKTPAAAEPKVVRVNRRGRKPSSTSNRPDASTAVVKEGTDNGLTATHNPKPVTAS